MTSVDHQVTERIAARPRRSRVKRWSFACLAMLLGSLGALAVLELTIRTLVPASHWRYHDATMDWFPDDKLGWAQRPNLDYEFLNERGHRVAFKTNVDGLQPETAVRLKQPETVRIMVFGDSTVVGHAVTSEHRVHSQLMKLLSGSYRVEVINAGVQGYSPDQSILQMEKLVPLYSPDFVLFAICENDFGGISSSSAYGLNKPSFVLNSQHQLIGRSFAANAKITQFQNPNRIKASIQKAATYRFLRPQIAVLRAKLGNWEQKNLLGVAQEFRYEPGKLDTLDWRLFSAILDKMKTLCLDRKAGFALYAHPDVGEVWDPYIRHLCVELGIEEKHYDRFALESRLQSVAQESGIEFVPLVQYFLDRQDEGPFHLLPRNPHCNEKGYQLTAEALAEYLQDYLIRPSS